MKKKQLGLLAVILLIPVLVFAFLKIFGENQYTLGDINTDEDLTVYNPRVVNCQSNEVEGIHRIPDFSFTNQHGEVFTKEDVKGKVYIAEFFFTRCPDICITMTSELLRVHQKFKDNANVHIVSHSVDPEHDTPRVLANYAEEYGINLDRWTFLTGPKEQIYEQARCGYFIVAKPNEDVADDFIHSDKLILVDSQQRIRGYYSGTSREDVDRLITEVQLLLQEEARN